MMAEGSQTKYLRKQNAPSHKYRCQPEKPPNSGFSQNFRTYKFRFRTFDISEGRNLAS